MPERSSKLPARGPAVDNLHRVLGAPGRPLARAERETWERRFGHDFSRVRIHDGAAAASSARQQHAAAYTVGCDIVLGRSAQRLTQAQRRQLLAHELVHVVQQRGATARSRDRIAPPSADDACEREAHRLTRTTGGTWGRLHVRERALQPTLQRFDLFREIAGLFAGDDFPEQELHDYLRVLRESSDTEGSTDSDNKARAVVRAWRAGNSPFVLTPTLMTLLIKEMQSGATLDDDEQAILELVERAENPHLQTIFGAGGIDADELLGDFHGEEDTRLRDFFARRFIGGLAALRAGRVEPKGAAVPLGRGLGEPATPSADDGDSVVTAGPDIMRPEDTHSYEAWIALFRDLPTFRARSGHQVLGAAAAPQATATDPNAPASERRPALRHGNRRYLPADRFIDGPTDEWVRRNLPPSLVEVAYELPSDCADVAVILRHVWLAAHGRTENYRGWICGAELSETRSRAVQTTLTQEVWTGSVERIVRPYTDANGARLRSWAALGPMLHPGDVLVWDHTLPGHSGHTHTVMQVVRDAQGRAQRLELLQGNQPISGRRAREIAPGHAQRQESLRDAPGRRIERSTYSGSELRDQNNVWTWLDGTTVLVAAGPPVAAGTPRARAGGAGTGGIGDWVGELSAATSTSELLSRFEAALLETRMSLETGQDADRNALETFGRAAGERLWQLANESARRRASQASRLLAERNPNRRPGDAELLAEDLGETSHYRPLMHMLGMLSQLGRDSRIRTTATAFAGIARSLEQSARGAMDIGFERSTQDGVSVANVLVTGFDPFSTRRGRQVAPERGRFNPSAAAVLQLDGTTVPGNSGQLAAVEGIVLPVSFGQFRSGLVESVLEPHRGQLDAVLTVSLSPNLAPPDPADQQSQGDALRLERFAVGVHRLNNDRLEPVPGIPGSSSAGPAIVEARGAEGIAAEPGLGPEQLRERREILFVFPSAAEADRALAAFGLQQQGSALVSIDDLRALQTIVATMERGVDGTGITFRVGAQAFQARIRRGPGGSFLSNEVSYRVLRFLAGGGGRQGAASFHIHTQRGTAEAGGTIPQAVGTRQERDSRRASLDLARGVVTRLVSNLRRLIAAVTRRVLGSRSNPDNR